MSAPTRGSILSAWEAAVAVTAAAYGTDEAMIRTQSRGRGPRPPAEAWEPRKMAVHLAVVLSGCSYASLGRVIGLHRDTVASHCAELRDHVLAEARAEAASFALEKLARARLASLHHQRIDAMRAHLVTLEEAASDLGEFSPSSDDLPTKFPTGLSYVATDHGNVISLVGTGRRR